MPLKVIRDLTFGVTLALLASASAIAGKPVSDREGYVVGHATDLSFSPDLSRSVTTIGRSVWTKHIYLPGASYIKLHLEDVNLRKGDTLTITHPKGHVIETITGRGPKDMGNFWALSVPGDRATLTFDYAAEYKQAPFEVVGTIAGNADVYVRSKVENSRSICSPADFEDAICSQTDAGRWANVLASVGVMTLGSNANSSLFCSGANVSPFNYILTNYDCISNQSECNNAEFVFAYYEQSCGANDPPLDWFSLRCDEVVAFEPQSCDAAPGSLSFTLASVLGDPTILGYGYVEIDPTPPSSGEDVYIVQHPAGRRLEISAGGGTNFAVDGTVLRYYGTLDTEVGSTGAPIFRESDHNLIGLHNCGGCETPGVGNRGVRMADIYPLIEPFLLDTDEDGTADGADDDDDNDGVDDVDEIANGTDSLDPDTDDDGIGDAQDSEPLIPSNLCTGGDGDNATLGVAVVEDLTCAARVTIDVQGSTDVMDQPAHLLLIAPTVWFQPGFSVLQGGRLTLLSADPCPGCSSYVVSTFDTDNEGWVSFQNGGAPVSFVSTGGNPEGYISVLDTTTGWAYLQAPAIYLVPDAYGGELSFDLFTATDELPFSYNVRVGLQGAGLTLINEAGLPTSTWMNYQFPLNETSGWRKFSDLSQNYSDTAPVPTPAEMMAVMANLTGLYIATDHTNGYSDNGQIDESNLDNVTLSIPP